MLIRMLTLVALAVTSQNNQVHAASLRREQVVEEQRELSGYYHTLTTSTLGTPNPDAAIGNPLKGLVESPVYTHPPYKPDLPLSVEFYYIGLNQIMKGNVNKVGEAAAFDWTYLDKTLADSASRNMHAAWRVMTHFPWHWEGDLFVPQYLISAGVEIRTYDTDKKSPYYGDQLLLEAFEQFITYAGKRYDGDKRLGFVQLGLLGMWGEWHSAGGMLPDEAKQKVIGWYAKSFTKTQLQVRYPEKAAYDAGFGRHDDSFTKETLDGEANGGGSSSYFYWPDMVKKNQGDSWKRGSMGGESENQYSTFERGYQARTYQKQSFMECVNITHTTWMLHHAVWKDNNAQGMNGEELSNARFAHARMGYNFHVPSISVQSSATSGQVNVDVTLTQIGVAPFYYDLGLGISCSGMSKKIVGGVKSLIDQGSSMVVTFSGLPANEECLKAVNVTLESSYAYAGRPIKFAQGNGVLSVRLPLPGSTPQGSPPATVPVQSPPISPSIPTTPSASPPSDAGQESVNPRLLSKLLGKLKRFFKFGK